MKKKNQTRHDQSDEMIVDNKKGDDVRVDWREQKKWDETRRDKKKEKKAALDETF